MISFTALLEPWQFFRLMHAGGEPYLFYRCPVDGSVIDWRDHEKHLVWHGIANAELRAGLVLQQEESAGVKR